MAQLKGGSTSGGSRILTTQDLEPIGVIKMYDANSVVTGDWIDNETMPGWYSCVSGNVSLGCPDLVGRFIMGKVVSGSGSTGGSNSIFLSTSNIPSHTHSVTHDHGAVTSVSGGVAHTHTTSVNLSNKTSEGESSHTHSQRPSTGTTWFDRYSSTGGLWPTEGHGNVFGGTATYGGSNHSHTHDHASQNFTSGGASATSHTHSVNLPSITVTSGSTGSGSVVDITPANYSVIFIKKIR